MKMAPIKYRLSFVILPVLLLIAATPIGAAIFEDTFIDQQQTEANWLNTGGNWTFPTDPADSYRGTWDGLSFAASTLADQGQGYLLSNLFFQTSVALGFENSAAGLWLAFDPEGNYVYQISIISDFALFSGQDKLVLSRVKDRVAPGGFAILSSDPPANGLSLDLGTFYSIEAAIDSQNELSVTLKDIDEQIIAALLYDLEDDPEFGGAVPDLAGVGIFAQDMATFEDFSLDGVAVPIPGVQWLLGFGIVGVLCLRRKVMSPLP